MSVRYTRRALRQLAEILDYIDVRSPQGAESVKRRIQAVIGLLADHPHAGRVANRSGLRRVVVRPYPYVIYYRPDEAGIVIHGVRHAARRPVSNP
ncbi:MAG: type II toxin-antitoxin system RelE/ParE family toxin [bacterium]|nr:type II toxin-antitoxin system RelE/ParE family toxin [bacterium]